MRLDFWTRFLSFFPNLTLSFLDDFVADVGKQAGSYVGNLIENFVDSNENWVDETERCIVVKVVALVSQDQTDSKKIWMIPLSRIVPLRVRIVIGSDVGCSHAIREHLLSPVS